MKIYYSSFIISLLLLIPICVYSSCSCKKDGQLCTQETDCEFYMRSSEGVRYPMVAKPNKREELRAKLRQLNTIEEEAASKLPPGSTVSFQPGYSYDFVWVESTSPLREHDFMVRRRTLGGYTCFYFDAEDYFDTRSWEEVERALKGDYEIEMDGITGRLEDNMPNM